MSLSGSSAVAAAAQDGAGSAASHGDANADAAGGGAGRDRIARILNSMGADRFDPRVVPLLREFMYRYVGEVLKESQVWAEHRTPANTRVELDLSDIQLAVEQKMKQRKEFTQRPDQAMLKELAESKNKIDLPQIPRNKTMPLPTAKNCLTAENFQVAMGNERAQARHQPPAPQGPAAQHGPQPKRQRTSKWGPSRAMQTVEQMRQQGGGGQARFVWLDGPRRRGAA